MFIEDWNSFYEQAEQLYRNDPLRTRYVMKYKHTAGRLILKVTDDRVVSSLLDMHCLLWAYTTCPTSTLWMVV